MFSHVMLGANDVAASKTVCDATFGALGIPPGKYDDKGRVIYASDKGLFMLTMPINGMTPGCRLPVARSPSPVCISCSPALYGLFPGAQSPRDQRTRSSAG